MLIKKLSFVFIFCIFFISICSKCQSGKPSIRIEDRIRLATAFELNKAIRDNIWQDWSTVPFPVVLVTDDYEYLIGHPYPSPDFTQLGYDSLLKSNVYYRKRIFQTTFLATFPAVSGIATVVIGTAENTHPKTSTPWIITLMHEHFHQLQMTRPDYFDAVKSLNLSKGDSTGMWMINYPFPYDSLPIQEKINTLCKKLPEAIESTSGEIESKVKEYLTTREELKQILSADDYKYFSFQLWQEGTAMYTEYQVAKYGSEYFTPPKEYLALNDYLTFDTIASGIHKNILKELKVLSLADGKRVLFYYLGAGEALLLDRIRPGWRLNYFTEKFFLDKYFQ